MQNVEKIESKQDTAAEVEEKNSDFGAIQEITKLASLESIRKSKELKKLQNVEKMETKQDRAPEVEEKNSDFGAIQASKDNSSSIIKNLDYLIDKDKAEDAISQKPILSGNIEIKHESNSIESGENPQVTQASKPEKSQTETKRILKEILREKKKTDVPNIYEDNHSIKEQDVISSDSVMQTEPLKNDHTIESEESENVLGVKEKNSTSYK